MHKTLWMGILAATLTTTALVATEAHSAKGTRSFAAGRFAFGIDGDFAGYIKKVSGGTVKGELGKTNPEPLTLEATPRAGTPMFEWIKASWDQGFVPKDIDLRLAGPDHMVTMARSLDRSRIASVTVPALDGSSKAPGYFTIKIDPQVIRYEKGTGKLKGEQNTNSKKWLCSNFKFELGDLPTERVAKIDSFTWKQGVIRDSKGKFSKFRAPEISDIRMTVSMDDYDAWAQWHEQFVREGKKSDKEEKTGSLSFLGPDMKEELLTINFDHVGIVSLEPTKTTKGQKAPAQFEVTLSVQALHLAK